MTRPTVFVMLGRAGDVINLLPLAKKHFDETGERPGFLVAAEFANILDGVSYVRPMVWRGAWQDCVEAVRVTRTQLHNPVVLDASVHGIGFFPIRHTASFDREAWFRAGADVPWGRLPLVFDKRDKDREARFVAEVFRIYGVKEGEPFILTSFSGVSSPFDSPELIWDALKSIDMRVIDVSTVRADRIFDLLALFERAAVFIASDSAPMHLAAAVPQLTVVMLTQDAKPSWHRSSWRPSHAARLFYSEAQIDPSLVVRAVRDVLDGRSPRRFYRVHSFLGMPDDDAQRRISVARASWREEMAWSNRWTDLFVDRLPRDSTTLGDPRPCAFSRDLIDLAASRCERWDDVIVLSNADVGISPGLTGWLTEAFIRSGAAFTHRWDRETKIAAPFVTEADTCAGRWYPGSDLWAFTKAWWTTWGDRYPDMVIGREAGDMILRHVIKQGGGVEIPGAVWHERHASFWELPGNRDGLPSNIHNRMLATTFLRDFGGSWNDGTQVFPGGITRTEQRRRRR